MIIQLLGLVPQQPQQPATIKDKENKDKFKIKISSRIAQNNKRIHKA
jgi:hypothetical protein